MAGEQTVVDRIGSTLGLLDLPRGEISLLLQLIGRLIVLLISLVVLLGTRQLVQRFEELLVLCKATAALVHTRSEGAFLLLGFFEVDLGYLDPPLLGLVVSESIKDPLLLRRIPTATANLTLRCLLLLLCLRMHLRAGAGVGTMKLLGVDSALARLLGAPLLGSGSWRWVIDIDDEVLLACWGASYGLPIDCVELVDVYIHADVPTGVCLYSLLHLVLLSGRRRSSFLLRATNPFLRRPPTALILDLAVKLLGYLAVFISVNIVNDLLDHLLGLMPSGYLRWDTAGTLRLAIIPHGSKPIRDLMLFVILFKLLLLHHVLLTILHLVFF